VQEAGGRISDLSGQPFQPRSGRLVASNGRIHDAMLETIAQFQAERSRNRTH
jgi:fructose-1,6-bisphosphatase/inositol monophosphatase family enzyme